MRISPIVRPPIWYYLFAENRRLTVEWTAAVVSRISPASVLACQLKTVSGLIAANHDTSCCHVLDVSPAFHCIVHLILATTYHCSVTKSMIYNKIAEENQNVNKSN